MNGLPSSSSGAIRQIQSLAREHSHGYTAALGCYNRDLERDRGGSPPPDWLAAAHQVAQISTVLCAGAAVAAFHTGKKGRYSMARLLQ
jgi:hypothetical protein